jgi:hypothetical protein
MYSEASTFDRAVTVRINKQGSVRNSIIAR